MPKTEGERLPASPAERLPHAAVPGFHGEPVSLRDLGRREIVLVAVLTAAAAVLGLAVFATIFTRNFAGDLELHTEMTLEAVETGRFEGNFLFYLLNAAASGFADDLRLIRGASAALLAGAVAAKFAVSWRIARAEVGAGRAHRTSAIWLGIPVAIWLVLLAFSLQTGTVYLGQLPPNVWHNSTTIFLMPFALWLFAATLAYLRTGAPPMLWWVLAAGALNVAIKPSFAMVTLVVFPLACLTQFGWDARLRRALYACAGVAVLIGLQYLYIFEVGDDTGSGVTLDPFAVWSFYSTNIPWSLLASLAFPLVALAAYRRRLWRFDFFRYAAALTAVAIAMFVVLAETGLRAFDGNFMWQAVVCVYVLFLSTIIGVLRIWLESGARSAGARVAVVAVTAAFLAHVAAGIGYLAYYLETGQFI